jgi:hypothetical protein
VTDCERAFRNAIKKTFPNLPLLRCWKHLFAAIERCVRAKGGSVFDIGRYISSVKYLLIQPTKQQFDVALAEKRQTWDNHFSSYFDNCILPDVDALAAYAIKKIPGAKFSDVSGITTNRSEGLNTVYKDILERIEVPLDVCVLGKLFKLKF